MTLFPDPIRPDREVHDRVFLGGAGWSYDDWDGVFYPPGLAARDRLSYYATQFKTVEIDSTFYGTPTKSTVQGWHQRTPDDFLFAAKFPRSITHDARLVNCADETYRFIENMAELGDKLGPLLLQFPPSFTAHALSDLARYIEGLPDGLMYAVEVRHRSWLTDEFADLLKDWGVALCMACEGAMGRFWRTTSRVAYIRWLGDHDAFETFESVRVDREELIDWWAPRIRHFTDQGGVVFGYVNNHYAGHSPETLRMIERKLREQYGS
ncbi:MAG: DUF72 domain-containing protein [bacterium]